MPKKKGKCFYNSRTKVWMRRKTRGRGFTKCKGKGRK